MVLMRWVSLAASAEIRADSATCRLISDIEAQSSSDAAATVWTLAVASAAAVAAEPACDSASLATLDMLLAVPCMSLLEAELPVIRSITRASKSPAMLRRSAMNQNVRIAEIARAVVTAAEIE